jgi:hypothetical protein
MKETIMSYVVMIGHAWINWEAPAQENTWSSLSVVLQNTRKQQLLPPTRPRRSVPPQEI